MKTKSQLYTYLLVIIGIIITLNILFDSITLRLDLTQDRRYTLSKSTKKILKELKTPVTVTAYFTEDVPAEVMKFRKELKELLVEYNSISKGKVVYEFKDPNKNQELENEAMVNGVQPQLMNMRQKNEVKQQKVYLGAVIKTGDKKEVILFYQSINNPSLYNVSLEYDLSSSIKKLSVTQKPVIGLVQGHKEASRVSMYQVENSLNVLYDIEHADMNDSVDVLSKYKTIAIVAPKDTFSDIQLAQLDNYLNNGNNLFLAINRVDANLQYGTGDVLKTKLENWLEKKGIMVENSFLVDKNCGQVMVMQKMGDFNMQTPMALPYLPIITNFDKHPVTKGLEMIITHFPSTIRFNGDTSKIHYRPLLKSSEASGVEYSPISININKQWTESDFSNKHLVLGALFEGKLGSNSNAPNSKLILIADGDFPINGEGQQAREISADNANLMVNSVDWLTDESGLMDLRTKEITARPLKEITDGKKSFIKYLNFLLPILMVVIYGIFRMQHKNNIRIKRMEEGYV